MDWKTMTAYITGSVDQELLLRTEYLVAENWILRNQLQGRLRLSDGERRTLAEFGKQLGKRVLVEVASKRNHQGRAARRATPFLRSGSRMSFLTTRAGIGAGQT